MTADQPHALRHASQRALKRPSILWAIATSSGAPRHDDLPLPDRPCRAFTRVNKAATTIQSAPSRHRGHGDQSHTALGYRTPAGFALHLTNAIARPLNEKRVPRAGQFLNPCRKALISNRLRSRLDESSVAGHIQPDEQAILHLVARPFLRLDARQPDATLEQRMPRQTQSVQAILDSRQYRMPKPSLRPASGSMHSVWYRESGHRL